MTNAAEGSGGRSDSTRPRAAGPPADAPIATELISMGQYWSGNRIDGSVAERLKHLLRMAMDGRCDHKDWARRLLHNASRSFDAINPRHDQIHQDDVGWIFLCKANRFFAIGCNPRHAVPIRAQDSPPERFHCQFQVIHNSDLHASDSPIRSATASSRVSSWKLDFVR